MRELLAAAGAGATVVTANNRLARSLALVFNREQQSEGRLAWRTPTVLPWSAWIQGLWETSLVSGGAAGAWTLLNEFQTRLVWQQTSPVQGTTPAATELVARAGQLAASWRLAPADLAAAADSADSQVFAAWAARHDRHSEAQGQRDTVSIVPLIAEDLRLRRIAAPGPVHFVGFCEWTPVQRDLLSALEAGGASVHEEPVPSVYKREAWRVSCHDSRAELEAAARWARHLMTADGARLVAIVVPDLATRLTEVRRTVLDVFAPDWRLEPAAELPVNFSYAAPLSTSGLAHVMLTALGGLAQQWTWQDACQLLRTPYLHGADIEAGQRAALDFGLRRRIGTMVTLGELGERAEAAAPLLAAGLGRFRAVARALPKQQGAAAWADSFRAALEALGWPGGRMLASDEYQAALACGELLDELRACDRLTGSLSLGDAVALLQGLGRERPFQPAGHPEGVQVLGVLEAIGQRFDAIWISGLTSERWPPAASPSPLLGLALQRRLGMPDSTPAATRAGAERLLRWLESSAPRAVLSCPQFDGEEPLVSSPLIGHLAEKAPSDIPQWPDRRPVDVIAASGATELLAPDPPPPLARGVRLRGGSSLIERAATCPARAFFEFRLGARELSVPVPGIDAATRGSLTHEALSRIWTQLADQEQLLALGPDEQSRLLETVARAAVARQVPQGDPLLDRLADLEWRRLRDVLAQLLTIERSRDPFRVACTEYEPDWGAAPGPLRELGLRVRIDRVDELADGSALVIDYKTGAKLPSLADLVRSPPRAPQLALYATLHDAQGVAWLQLAAAGVRWSGIGPESWGISGLRSPETLGEYGIRDWSELRESWRSALARLAADISRGRFEVDRWRRREASGQWAMVTRIHELPDEGREEDD